MASIDNAVTAQQLADMLPTGVAILDHEDGTVFVNSGFRELMTSKMARTFDCWSSSIHPDDYEHVAEAYREASRTHSPLRVEYRTRKQPYPWRLLILTPLREDERERFKIGKEGGFLCTISDITQEKSAELSQKKIADDAEQRKLRQERFIDMISHEVRNPLSAILHCTEDILESVSQENPGDIQFSDIAQAAETISLCVTHQKKIVDDVLTFSKLDAAMLTLSPHRVQPRRRLARSLTMFKPELRKQNIAFEYKLDDSYTDCSINWVMADLDRMSQVLINLVSNAIKFTAKSGDDMHIRVSVGASRQRPPSYPPNVVFFNSGQSALRLDATRHPEWGDGERIYIMVAVKDTGIGISDEAQKRLFERFNQATPRTENIYGGSGLGLNVSRRLCHLHGGEIGVSSKEGEGSTFGFFFSVRRSLEPSDGESSGPESAEIDKLCREIQSLSNDVTDGQKKFTKPSIPENPPVAHVEELKPHCKSDRQEHTAKIASDVDSSSSRQTDSESKNVLLVEDNIINQQIVARKLTALGYSVTPANNGRDALDEFQKKKFDCILMDQVMPVMDGNSATRAIRDMEKGTPNHVPVLGVTANVRSEQRTEMLDAGMDDVVQKPYRMNDLSAKISHLIMGPDEESELPNSRRNS
ncbi:hypothetical protein BDV59DRAFT_207371 [Aspergillus ambiguus]|uniref:uncharacterized protein n=1 Tax=Aspergillus ambiguus TaxID=176160 RepID=UPI003CCD3DB9